MRRVFYIILEFLSYYLCLIYYILLVLMILNVIMIISLVNRHYYFIHLGIRCHGHLRADIASVPSACLEEVTYKGDNLTNSYTCLYVHNIYNFMSLKFGLLFYL